MKSHNPNVLDIEPVVLRSEGNSEVVGAAIVTESALTLTTDDGMFVGISWTELARLLDIPTVQERVWAGQQTSLF